MTTDPIDPKPAEEAAGQETPAAPGADGGPPSADAIRPAGGFRTRISQREQIAKQLGEPLLEVKNLKTHFELTTRTVRAVDGIDFTIRRGETFCVVGESGSGKSITAMSIMQLIPKSIARHPEGEILFHPQRGKNVGETFSLLGASDEQMLKIRGARISQIFQEPMTSLNPVHTIGDQIAEALFLHTELSPKEVDARVLELLEMVGIPDAADRLRDYPHRLSGGQRQRVMIAIAMACEPDLLIADEPTTALDVTIQRQILELMNELQRKNDMSILFITHDFGVVNMMADRVAVMRLGKIVEMGDLDQILRNPQHDYTKQLIASLPENLRKERLEAEGRTGEATAGTTGTLVDTSEEAGNAPSPWDAIDAPASGDRRNPTLLPVWGIISFTLYWLYWYFVSFQQLRRANSKTGPSGALVLWCLLLAAFFQLPMFAGSAAFDWLALIGLIPMVLLPFPIAKLARRLDQPARFALWLPLLFVALVVGVLVAGTVVEPEAVAAALEYEDAAVLPNGELLDLPPHDGGIAAAIDAHNAEVKSSSERVKLMTAEERGTAVLNWILFVGSLGALILSFLLGPAAQNAMNHLWREADRLFAEQARTRVEIAEREKTESQPDKGDELLEVEDLQVYFPIRKGLLRKVVGHVKAVDHVSLAIPRGRILALVGESGSGKTTLGRALLRLVEPTGGRVWYKPSMAAADAGPAFDDEDMPHSPLIELTRLGSAGMRVFRRELQFVFQDPYSSLNPRLRIATTLTEPMAVHGIGANHAERLEIAAGMLETVQLDADMLQRYPHEFSGGQRQRIGLARALVLNPSFIVCDEVTSALDVSVQAEVLQLLLDLRDRFDLTLLFITHNIAVVEYLADEVAVMYKGKIVERGRTDDVCGNPQHSYSQKLLSAVPRVDLG